MPELKRCRAEEIIRVLSLVSVLTMALPFLLSVFPTATAIFPAFWIASLILDLYTTYRFYRQNPEQFRKKERNVLFGFLTDKLGFQAATFAFILLVEIPFAMVLAFVLVPQVYMFIFGVETGLHVYFSSALGVIGFTHFQAALRNHVKERKAEKRRRINDLLVESIIESMAFGSVVLRFLELNSPLKRDEISEKPELFAMELEALLGDGAKIIEERIIRNLYVKMGMKFKEMEGYTFQDYVRDAKEKYFKHSY